jgi:hypothetical protein
VPLFTEIRMGGDAGKPVAAAAPNSAPGQAFINIAKAVQTAAG